MIYLIKFFIVVVLGVYSFSNVVAAELATIGVAGSGAMYECSGANDQEIINEALFENVYTIIISGTYDITNTVIIPENKKLICFSNTVFNVSNMPETIMNSVIVNDGGVLANLSVAGDISTLIGFRKKVTVYSNASIYNIKIINNSYGIECKGNNILINGVEAENIKSLYGSAIIHCSGSDVYDINISNIIGKYSDRAIEIEEGAHDIAVNNCEFYNIGENLTYTFVLSVHNHAEFNKPACYNVVFEDVLLQDCWSGCTATAGHSDEYGTTITENIIFRRIDIIRPVINGDYGILNCKYSEDITFEDIYIDASNCGSQQLTGKTSQSKNTVFKNINIDNFIYINFRTTESEKTYIENVYL